MSYYRIKYRPFLPNKIVANADPLSRSLNGDMDPPAGTAVRAMDVEITSDAEDTPVGVDSMSHITNADDITSSHRIPLMAYWTIFCRYCIFYPNYF